MVLRRSLSPSIAFVLYMSASIAWAATIRVPGDKATIQAAISSATNGDTVLVYPGTYYENICFRGKKIVLTSRYCETSDTTFILSTILNGSNGAGSDTGSVVRITNGEDSTAVLQGFTITGGSGTNWTDEHGAGVYREGGGVLVAGCSPTIQFNLIIGNTVSKNSKVTSAGGGGMRIGDGNPSILNNIVVGNTGRYGAGVVLNYTGATVRNNIMTGNSGGQDYGGGALWINQNGPAPKLIENNTIANNAIVAVYVYQGSSTFRNDIFWGTSSSSGAQLVVRAGSQTVTYSDVQGGFGGVGNIASDPQFADSHFHLLVASPCVDAGDTAVALQDRADTSLPGSALWPSMGGRRNDMGAYGGSRARVLPLVLSLTSAARSGLVLPGEIRLEQNYPNPFNPKTVISGQWSLTSVVRLAVYDILGREVAVLADGRYPAGKYSFAFDGSRFSSGVYFYELTSGATRLVRSMALVK